MLKMAGYHRQPVPRLLPEQLTLDRRRRFDHRDVATQGTLQFIRGCVRDDDDVGHVGIACGSAAV